MGYRGGDETIEFEGRIEHSTPKAVLIEPLIGPKAWCPRSQIVLMDGPFGDSELYTFVIKEWIAKKNGWA